MNGRGRFQKRLIQDGGLDSEFTTLLLQLIPQTRQVKQLLSVNILLSVLPQREFENSTQRPVLKGLDALFCFGLGRRGIWNRGDALWLDSRRRRRCSCDLYPFPF